MIYFQCKSAGIELQEKVLKAMFELQNSTKVLQKSKENHAYSLKKLNVSFQKTKFKFIVTMKCSGC